MRDFKIRQGFALMFFCFGIFFFFVLVRIGIRVGIGFVVCVFLIGGGVLVVIFFFFPFMRLGRRFGHVREEKGFVGGGKFFNGISKLLFGSSVSRSGIQKHGIMTTFFHGLGDGFHGAGCIDSGGSPKAFPGSISSGQSSNELVETVGSEIHVAENAG